MKLPADFDDDDRKYHPAHLEFMMYLPPSWDLPQLIPRQEVNERDEVGTGAHPFTPRQCQKD